MPKLHPEFDAAEAHENGNKNPKHKIAAKRKSKICYGEPRCQGDSKAQVDYERSAQPQSNEMLSPTKPLKKKCHADADEDSPKQAWVKRLFDIRQAKDASNRSWKHREHEA